MYIKEFENPALPCKKELRQPPCLSLSYMLSKFLNEHGDPARSAL